MSDPRFDSGHLFCPRRQEYQHARDAVLKARGWLTADECAQGLIGEAGDWPSLLSAGPDQVLPGTRYVLVDPDRDRAYPLRTGLSSIGRLPSNDIVLHEIQISRRHCVILVHAWGGCKLHDTASRNGTQVNGKFVQKPVELNSGDQIGLCARRFLFVRETDWPAAAENDDHPETAWI
jgi:pSer/pThr/pTyr-binding forkhead associated (FHA) protein